MKTNSTWINTAPSKEWPSLDKDLSVDVLVVGAGITGITAGLLARRAGLSVAVVDRDGIGGGETGHTTAHLAYVTDTRLPELVKTFGRDHAQAAWDAGAAAMAKIEELVKAHSIACELHHVPGFLVSAQGKDLEAETRELQDEARLAVDLGFEAAFVETAPLTGRPAVRYANQMKFHPLKYLRNLAQVFADEGGHLFNNTDVFAFEENPRRAIAAGKSIQFDKLVLATHMPLQGNTGTLGAALFQTKLAAFSTYAIAAEIPGGVLPLISWWDTADPYLYIRIDSHGDHVIIGGEDHKTGQSQDTEECFRHLEKTLRDIFPTALPGDCWSGQVIETNDGLPFIGPVSEHQFIATGFAGNGMTYGTLSGMMAVDWLRGISNPWAELFDVHRKKLSAAWDYIKENKDYPWYLAKGYLSGTEDGEAKDLAPGEGKVLRYDGRRIAACRDGEGTLHLLSPVCPHLGCLVTWNEAEKTWDCPCHGSRFMADGSLIAGPSERPLEKLGG